MIPIEVEAELTAFRMLLLKLAAQQVSEVAKLSNATIGETAETLRKACERDIDEMIWPGLPEAVQGQVRELAKARLAHLTDVIALAG